MEYRFFKVNFSEFPEYIKTKIRENTNSNSLYIDTLDGSICIKINKKATVSIGISTDGYQENGRYISLYAYKKVASFNKENWQDAITILKKLYPDIYRS
jgi:hypothetical protein